ncbi:ABC transporter substrate-binding protein [Eggerthellaceae bacterium zg-1084]|uniref:ABC transporter substrate-binding protein n=1 Tax=Berryella wangjianweii TaxID=2734634 RepID=UPI001552B58B|nr:ABC transporter substrate-binding protein [Berryella wangjianweii]NPD31073.1 ABC transporter substrate-binding protein [Berryella wangjianweii]NPD31935.1 ABC transporter substrate-binding protein [Eggerthellaceae bacterium zg-997]
MRALLALALCCACALALTSCAGGGASAPAGKGGDASAGASATVPFTDSCGRQVQLPREVRTVAVSGPLAQQVLMTLAPEKLVGFARDLSQGEAAYFSSVDPNLPVLGQLYGGKGDFNKEAVAAAAPDLVIDVGEAKKSIVDDMDQLQEQLGIPCVHVEAKLATYGDAYRMLGKILGVEERAEKLASYCDKAFGQVSQAMEGVSESDRPRALYLVGDAGLNVIPKGSFHAQTVDMVLNNAAVLEKGSGGKGKGSGGGMGSEVSFEQIASWNPQMIVFGPRSVYDAAASDEAWQTLDAVKAGRYVQVPSTPYNWLGSPPSVNQLLGVQWLARMCYPEKFEGSMQDMVTEYYRTFYGHELTQDEYDKLMKGALL